MGTTSHLGREHRRRPETGRAHRRSPVMTALWVTQDMRDVPGAQCAPSGWAGWAGWNGRVGSAGAVA